MERGDVMLSDNFDNNRYPEKNVDSYYTDEDYLDISGSCSAHDCTGLIPSGEEKTEDLDEYKELYQYGFVATDLDDLQF